MKKHQHNWNRSLPRSDEFHTGWACEDCSALITDDNIVVEPIEANLTDLLVFVPIVLFIAVLIYG